MGIKVSQPPEPGYLSWSLAGSGQVMLLPTSVAQQLAEQAELLRLEEAARELAEEMQRPAPTALSRPKPTPGDPHQIDIEAVDTLDVTGSRPGAYYHQVWDLQAMRDRVNRHNAGLTGDKETRKRDSDTLKTMITRGCQLPIRRVDEAPLRELAEDFGYLQRALDLLRADLLVSGSFQPLLVVGPPGVGKSYFANTLAELLDLERETIDASTGVNSTALMGVQRGWANTEPGLLFRHLALTGHSANPVFVVDELEKANPSRDEARYRLHDCLLPLLEPTSAARVKDLSVEMEIDASKISWIGLANSIKGIPRPLLSRFRLVTPDEPTASQRLHVARRIADRVTSAAGLRRADRTILRELADRTPREILQALQSGANRAVIAGRTAIQAVDVAELIGVKPAMLH